MVRICFILADRGFPMNHRSEQKSHLICPLWDASDVALVRVLTGPKGHVPRVERPAILLTIEYIVIEPPAGLHAVWRKLDRILYEWAVPDRASGEPARRMHD